jgi:DNA invertase Pin-like site-specific DNA recombinase
MQKQKIGYARTSRPDENIENQILAIRAKTGKDAKIFMDAGVSGRITAWDRPGFSQMVDYISENEKNGEDKIEDLYVYELSRIGRTMFETLDVINWLEKEKDIRVRSVSPKESWMDSSEKSIRDLMLAIFSWFAQQEREVLSQRTKEGIARARSEGKHIGRPLVEIDWDQVEAWRTPDKQGRKIPYTAISRLLDVGYSTLMRYKKERGKNKEKKING